MLPYTVAMLIKTITLFITIFSGLAIAQQAAQKPNAEPSQESISGFWRANSARNTARAALKDEIDAFKARIADLADKLVQYTMQENVAVSVMDSECPAGTRLNIEELRAGHITCTPDPQAAKAEPPKAPSK